MEGKIIWGPTFCRLHRIDCKEDMILQRSFFTNDRDTSPAYKMR